MMDSKLIVSSSPHVRSNEDTSYIMKQVIIALLPATLAGVYFFRLSAINVMFWCILGSVGFEWLCQKLSKKESTIGDFSAVVTGLLLAFNVPASLPWWMCLAGAAFAIIVVKMVFGGIGNNFVNPALAARAFLLASFPVPMTKWTETGVNWVAGSAADAVTTATPLSFLKSGAQDFKV
ncbi:MAG: RnfABCDGE type electron transport complex subunit D [Paeniclostridium sp.]